MTPTRMQQMMIDDGCPPQLFLSEDERRAQWERNPPRAMPVFNLKPRDEDAATAAFRAQVEAERRQKSLNQIAKMKNRFASKTIDYSKMRWDQRRGKFVPDAVPAPKSAPVVKAASCSGAAKQRSEITPAGADNGWSRIKAHNARALAELNGVWEDRYAKLSGGLLVMIVTNRLKGLVKKGETIKWSADQ